jgi:hypothetical protein
MLPKPRLISSEKSISNTASSLQGKDKSAELERMATIDILSEANPLPAGICTKRVQSLTLFNVAVACLSANSACKPPIKSERPRTERGCRMTPWLMKNECNAVLRVRLHEGKEAA